MSAPRRRGRWRLRVARVAVMAGVTTLTVASVGAAAEPPLVEAVKNRDGAAVRRLLDEGADPNQRQSDGATALHWAVHRDDVDAVNLLLDAGADVNAVNRLGASSLFIAAKAGHDDLIDRLLAAGADAGHALPQGETPLMTAARTGAARGVRSLLDAGADAHVREHSRGQTALMWAVAQGHHDVVRALLDGGADVAAHSTVRPRLMYTDASNGGAFDRGMVESLGGYSPLLFAARHGDTQSADLLLTAGADVDDTAGNDASALVVATHSGHKALARLLLERGADPDGIGAGYNALHAAVLRGDLDTVVALLAHGADPDVRLRRPTPVQRASEDWSLKTSMVSATPYWLAATFREPEIMRALAEGGADATVTTTERRRRLRERADEVDPSEPDVVGGFVSALQAAVRGASDRGRFYVIANDDPVGEERRALDTVSVAAEHGVDVAHADFTGSTALHDAAARNLVSVVRFLAERGADVDGKNGRGQTALDIAVASSRRRRLIASLGPDWSGPTVIDVLKEFGATESESPARSRN